MRYHRTGILGFALLTSIFAAPSFALASPITTKCGAVISSTVLTEDTPTATTSTSFVNISGASVNITVPAGTKRCVKVLFTGETDCTSSATARTCKIRARVGATEMNPTGSGNRDFGNAKDGSGARAYQWVRQVSGPGTFTITVQTAVSSAGVTFRIDDWSMEVEVSEGL
jgi:hypothetical protein